jgi:hypothetical protein
MTRDIQDPIIVIGTPRSGTAILYYTLAMQDDLWHLPGESHSILEGPLKPDVDEGDSNRAVPGDLMEAESRVIRERFHDRAINLNKVMPSPGGVMAANTLTERVMRKAAWEVLGAVSRLQKNASIRFIEKTPKNSLRVPLLAEMFPDARFVFNHRNPIDNIDSLVAGWFAKDKLGPFERNRYSRASYPIMDRLDLQDYDRERWCFALVPDWIDLEGSTVGEVATWQYFQCTRIATEDLAARPDDRVFEAPHHRFVREPVSVAREVFEWADLEPSPRAIEFADELPRLNQANPGADPSGLRHPDAIRRGLERFPEVAKVAERLGYRTDLDNLEASHGA